MKLLSPTQTVELCSLPDDLLPNPCCAGWSENALHCPIHSRPQWQIDWPPGQTTNDGKHNIRCEHGYNRWHKCPDSPDGEHHFQYVWLGWPGTWCVYCRTDDGFEVCLMRTCSCQCHSPFWKKYWWEAMEFEPT